MVPCVADFLIFCIDRINFISHFEKVDQAAKLCGPQCFKGQKVLARPRHAQCLLDCLHGII